MWHCIAPSHRFLFMNSMALFLQQHSVLPWHRYMYCIWCAWFHNSIAHRHGVWIHVLHLLAPDNASASHGDIEQNHSLHDIVHFIYQKLNWFSSFIVRFTHHWFDSSFVSLIICLILLHLLLPSLVALMMCFILDSFRSSLAWFYILDIAKLPKHTGLRHCKNSFGLHFLRLTKQLNHISLSPALQPQRESLKVWILHIQFAFIPVCVTVDFTCHHSHYSPFLSSRSECDLNSFKFVSHLIDTFIRVFCLGLFWCSAECHLSTSDIERNWPSVAEFLKYSAEIVSYRTV